MNRLGTAVALATLPALWLGAWLAWLVALGVERVGLPGYGTCLLVAWLGVVLAWALQARAVSDRRGQVWSVAVVAGVTTVLYVRAGPTGLFRTPTGGLSTLLVLVPMVAFLWREGAQAFLARQSGETVRRALLIALVALASLAVVAHWTRPVPLATAVIGVFLSGGIGLALVQVRDVEDLDGGAPALGAYWLVPVAGALALAGLLAVTIATVLLPGGLALLGAGLRRTPEAVWRFLVAVLVALVTPVFAVFEWLAQWLMDALRRAPPVPAREQPADLEGLAPALRNGDAALPPLVTLIITFVVVLAVLALVARWLAGAVRRYNDGQEVLPAAVRESLFSWTRLGDDARGLARAVAAAVASRRGERSTVGGVRALYGRLLAVGAAKGRARASAATPYEYRAVAVALAPGRAADVTVLTEAYVAARYGGLEPGPGELADLAAATRRIEDAAPG